MYYVYILKSLKDGSYYVGSTRDIEERLQRHNQGRSKYTKNKRPWELIYSEAHSDRSSALKREQEIKQHKRSTYIEQLVSYYGSNSTT
jgi:putative endonuclease